MIPVRKEIVRDSRRKGLGELSEVLHEISVAIGAGQLGEPSRTHEEDPLGWQKSTKLSLWFRECG